MKKKHKPHICPVWFAYTFDNPIRRLFHKPEQLLGPYVKEGTVVADIGCGMGYFTLGLARLVKEKGRVLAIDIQKKMLAKVEKRARRAGVAQPIELIQSRPDHIGINREIDFALAFWMVHETTHPKDFIQEIHARLKPGGLLLITEPKLHVTAREFAVELRLAQDIGFHILSQPAVMFSRSALLQKKNG